MTRAHDAAKCFIRAAEALFAHPIDVGRAAVWAAIGMTHLSHVPGVERGERLARSWVKSGDRSGDPASSASDGGENP